MRNLSVFFLASVFIVSCRNTTVINVAFEGELYAKNTVGVRFDVVSPEVNTDFQWFVADNPSGKWEMLEGIYTQDVVLLMEYAGKYLKCEITAWKQGKKMAKNEIVSAKPIANLGNPNTDWFRNAGLGLMVHFLKGVYTDEDSKSGQTHRSAPATEWNEIVDGFDVNLFAGQCEEAGVKYVLWALGQNDGFYNSPNAAYDKITGVKAGDLCSKRDLPADLIRALKEKGVKLMFYLPGNPPISNEEVTKKFQYTFGKDSPTSQFTQECWEAVIREWSLRYGEDLYGWWFDGMYRGGIIETRSDMSLEHNISTHTLAAKAGNRHSIVSYNYGVAEIQSDSPYDDYSAGEENNIVQLPAGGRWVLPGIQWFHFTHLGEFWAKPGVKHKTSELELWSRKVFENEGVLCFDVHVKATGEIDSLQREQLRAIANVFAEFPKK